MSGFSYPEWIGDVYPTGTKRDGMLAEYSKIFNAVEINMSFRRTPVEKTIDRWRDTVPSGFTFSMKANQSITHWKRLVDTAEDVADFVKASQRLGDRLGPILFQVRPTMQFDENVLDAFCAGLVPGVLYAFEPRNASFMTPVALDALRRHGVALCLNDDLFDPLTYATTGPFAYFRFHRDFYSPEDLSERAAMVKAIDASGTDAYVFFAHEDNPDSVKPALTFKELVT